MAELSGQSFAGYEILAKLGEGGFGAVYKARQPALNRFVAIKILASHLAADAEFVARFKREATLAASFNHPNLVLVYAAGESDGSQFMAMEFVEGTTLGHHIESHGKLKPREALAITVYVAQALQYAWNKSRLIHRDIKPDNIFVSVAGEIKVGDLGLAKSVDQSTAGMTATGMMMGSPHYISPEQAGAKKDIDFRADIYSLGCTLYQMLTGKTPYEGNDPMVVMGLHVNAPPPAMFKVWPQCPMPLALLVGKMLKKNPRERHASYEELIAELTAVHEKLTAAQTASAALPTGTITFLFTDIEGSTQLWEKHPQAMPIALERHNQILRRTMESHGGFVFKTVGDAFCVAFASAPNAMGAALAAQRALSAEPWGETGPLRVRMALHTGAAEERGGDYFGPTLNRVARVLSAGHGGQVLLSNATEQLVRDHLTEGVSLGDLGERSLKNLTRTERIFQINLPDLPTEFPTLRAAAAATPTPKSMQQARRSPAIIYGVVGAVAIALVAGLLLWSPWKARQGSESRLQAESVSGKPATAGTPNAADAAAALKLLGNVFTNAVGAEMVYIPPGEFLMGSTKEEQAWAVANGAKEEEVKREGEAPRKATIKHGFWLGRTEVTVGQWKQFVKETGYVTAVEKKGETYVPHQGAGKPYALMKGKSWRDPNFGFEPQNDHPVSCIGWNDAVAFCEWMTEREQKAGRLAAGMVVRLPTEAEWEYACRAGTQTKFWWGESKEDGKGRLNWGGKEDGFEFVAPVDSYDMRGRNRFGLADMLGNVYEWCLDEYDSKQAHEECYKGNPGGRVLRGGSFDLTPAFCRAASRSGNHPSFSPSYRGFRVAVGVDVSGGRTAAAPTSRGVDDAFLREVAALPAEQQVARVVAKLKELNPTLDLARTTHRILPEERIELLFEDEQIRDLSPLAALKRLERLERKGDRFTGRAPLSDLSALRGLDLKHLSLRNTQVSDLSALRGMHLDTLILRGTLVSDLSPLHGMPLRHLQVQSTPVSDLSPLAGMPLEVLHCSSTQVRDLSVLSGMPLRSLNWDFKRPEDLALVRSIKTLEGIKGLPAAEFWKQVEAGKMPGSVSSSDEASGVMDPAPVGSAFTREVAALPAEQQVARVAAKLKELNPGFDGKVTPTIEGGKVVGLEFSTEFVADISPVRALGDLRSLVCAGQGSVTALEYLDDWPTVSGKLADLSPLQGLKLSSLNIAKNHISDLTPLAGMPLTNLFCGGTDVADLRPLAGAPLALLTCSKTQVSDLSPLKGAPLEFLELNYCPASNLSSLAGLPLKHLAINNCKQIADLSPLKGMQLRVLRCSVTLVSDLTPLKGMQIYVLFCMGTKVKDLSPLRGMPVGDLRISDTLVEDLSPLQDMRIQSLQCNFKPERDTTILHSIKMLKTINKVPVAEFWRKVEMGIIPPPPIIIQKADEERLLDLGGGVTLELVAIPPGEFLMGSTKEEQAWAVANGAKEDEAMKREGEAPRMTRIKDGFWLGRTEVTAGQWKQFVKETGYVTAVEKKGETYVPHQGAGKPYALMKGKSWRDPGFGSPPLDNHPVCCVSWNDAMAFCKWLTERERKAGRLPAEQVIRLPTEAEWEYACRAGTQTKFWWGESKEDGKGRLNWGGKEDGFEFVAPVDSYDMRGRNRFGLADMLGNVREWCLDEYDAKQAHEECYRGYSGARVLRGGSWNTPPALTRCAACNNLGPARWHTHVGFRVALGLPR